MVIKSLRESKAGIVWLSFLVADNQIALLFEENAIFCPRQIISLI